MCQCALNAVSTELLLHIAINYFKLITLPISLIVITALWKLSIAYGKHFLSHSEKSHEFVAYDKEFVVLEHERWDGHSEVVLCCVSGGNV